MADTQYGQHNSKRDYFKMLIGNKVETCTNKSQSYQQDAKDCITCKKQCTNVVQCKSKKLSNSLT